MIQQKQEQPTVADDPRARERLHQAFEKTARWQKDFKGFTADLTVNVNGKETNGPIMVKGPREVSVQLDDAEVQKWCDQIMEKSPTAISLAKRSFNLDSENIRAISAMGMEALKLYYDTDESREGVEAFNEKRKPDFRSKMK